jgi:hypothetical protein
MNDADRIRAFGMANLQLNSELQQVEHQYGVGLRAPVKSDPGEGEPYYGRFEAELRGEALAMASHYQVFYCLENTIRGFISDLMEGAYGADWWEKKVDDAVKKEAKDNKAREEAAGVAPRSDDAIDYVTFGQLGDIIEKNWDVFAGALRNRKAVRRVLATLNAVRAPIAHSTLLPDDEVARLRVALRDWFRQMER